MSDKLESVSVDVPFVDEVGEDSVSTRPETVTIVLAGEQLAAVNRIRRALVTNRETLLGNDQNFGTNQDTVRWLIDRVTQAIQ